MVELRMDYAKIAPAGLKAMLAPNAYLNDCSIDQGLRRLVELRVSQINNCTYCIWLHAKQARDVGESDERVSAVENWREAGHLFTEQEHAVFNWTEAVTHITDGFPADPLFDELREHMDDRQVVDLTVIAASMNAMNRLAISFRHEAPGEN